MAIKFKPIKTIRVSSEQVVHLVCSQTTWNSTADCVKKAILKTTIKVSAPVGRSGNWHQSYK